MNDEEIFETIWNALVCSIAISRGLENISG